MRVAVASRGDYEVVRKNLAAASDAAYDKFVAAARR